MKNIFNFGEKVEGYSIRVLNEREVRAAAGILFFFAIMTFTTAFLTGNFYPTKVFVILFLTDFIIRIFINPKYSPSMILGRIMVSSQKPEYVGATQKKFAWAIGLILSIIMLFSIVINNIIGPLNMIVCIICLILLFFESAFGICWGCKLYNLFNRDKAKLCPGGNCEMTKKEEIQKVNFIQIVVVISFFILIFFITNSSFLKTNDKISIQKTNIGTNIENKTDTSSCIVPDWAKKMGHEEMYRQHQCK